MQLPLPEVVNVVEMYDRESQAAEKVGLEAELDMHLIAEFIMAYPYHARLVIERVRMLREKG